ncbi:alpha-D-ribose 1-methylphosphonate 5-triphosphate diphosphatase [Natronorubrum sp. DTA7]|uniref:alpha-D-ribose 1-methylphosphonate 5-triphosphate diphosphatase n=1 Tax=Natronorubrum sp. DTA7 TaxID=3447016 RepID=UPI003F84A20D
MSGDGRAVSKPDTAESHNSRTVVLENGRIVTPSAVIGGPLLLEGDRIAGVDRNAADADERIDVDGSLVMPGLIDVHGDDIENQLFPRNSRIDIDLALMATDRATLAAGITTKFHAIAFEDAPEDNRSSALASELVDRIEESSLLADHRIHARCELTEAESVRGVRSVLEADIVGLVSLMNHVPGTGQFETVEQFKEWYVGSADHTEAEADEIIELRRSVGADELERRIETVVSEAETAGVRVASHDDETAREVDRLADYGVDMSEYPITMDAAERAAERGLWTSMGAPNLVRGGSQWGNLGTAEAIGAGVVDVLCADYHPPSLLKAPFVETGESLPERVRRVTAAPAAAVGLTDRGRIEEDARADVVVVDPEPGPRVECVFVGGEEVSRTGGVR